jgi:hypothetical protein
MYGKLELTLAWFIVARVKTSNRWPSCQSDKCMIQEAESP